MSFLDDSLRPNKEQRLRREEPIAERIRGRSSAVRKGPNLAKPAKKQHEVDRRSVGKVGEPPTWEQCRARNCLKKPSSAHGLCHDHGKQIADAFQLFYVAAQNVVEGLATWEIKPLPKSRTRRAGKRAFRPVWPQEPALKPPDPSPSFRPPPAWL